VKCVVTGGAGFIGSHLVARLLRDGHEVLAIDDLTAGHLENLSPLKSSERLRLSKVSITQRKPLVHLLAGADVVFHLAAFADLRASLKDHRRDLEVNTGGMVNLLDAMTSNSVPHLVFSSTSSLYGEAQEVPTPESYAPTQTSLYGASKLAAEAFAEAFTEFTDLSLWTFRFSNVIGERCRRGVIWDYLHKLARNPHKLEILGDGNQSKEFLYVADCVDGMMLGYHKTSEKVNKFNLATETNMTPDEIADIVIDELGLKRVRRTYTGGKGGWVGDNPVVRLDVTRMRTLGWSAVTPSDVAIRRTVRWTVANNPAVAKLLQPNSDND
jgi:UDP-glucose 4-epimerase